MNKKISNNKYILKGTRKWHDFMHSNISVTMFLVIFTLIIIFILMTIIVCNCGVAW